MQLKGDEGPVNDHLAPVLEIHRNPVTNDRLHLACAPIRCIGMRHQLARFQKWCQHDRLRAVAVMEVLAKDMEGSREDLVALVSSRICHDLINPMGAISNGIELLETIGKSVGPELELVAESVANATARLNYFRIAFGQAEAEAQLRNAVLQKTIEEMFVGTRMRVNFISHNLASSRRAARTMLLTVMCADAAMPLGGDLEICEVSDGWDVTCKGRRLQMDADLWQGMCRGALSRRIASAEVQFAAAAIAVRDYDLRLDLAFDETAILLKLREKVAAET